MQNSLRRATPVLVLAAVTSASAALPAPAAAQDVEWRSYGSDAAGTK